MSNFMDFEFPDELAFEHPDQAMGIGIAGGASGLTQTLSGKIYQETDWSGWAGSGSFSALAATALLVGPASSIQLNAPSGTMAGGVREVRLYVLNPGLSNETWVLMADGGTGSAVDEGGPWKPQICVSTDRGLTWGAWAILDVWASGTHFKQGGASATVTTRFHLGITFSGGNYYLCCGYTTAAPGSNQVSASPYLFDVWRNASLQAAGWIYVGNGIAPGGAATFDDRDAYAFHQVFDGANWQMFYSATESENGEYYIGRSSAASPAGPWIAHNNLLPDAIRGEPENPTCIYLSGQALYNLWVNQVNKATSKTDRNRTLLSSSLTDWSAATFQDVMPPAPAWGASAIGVASPLLLPAGGALLDAGTGRYSLVFDTDPTDGNHIGRKGKYAPVSVVGKAAHFVAPAVALDFSADHSPALGWTNRSGQALTTSGGVLNIVNAPTPNSVNVLSGFSAANGSFDLVYNGPTFAFVLRRQGDGSMVVIYFNDLAQPRLYNVNAAGVATAGAFFNSANPANFLANTDMRIRCQAQGNVYSVYMDQGGVGGVASTLLGTVTDATISAAGEWGLEAEGAAGGGVVKSLSGVNGDFQRWSKAQAWDASGGLVIEMWADVSSVSNPAGVGFELLQTSGAGYRFSISAGGALRAEKVDAAGLVTATLAAGAGAVGVAAGMQGWLKVVISAAGLIKGYWQGELQLSVTDATWTNGTKIGVIGSFANGHCYAPTLRTGESVTVTGTQAGDVVTLRGPSGIPLASVTAAGASVALNPGTLASYPAPEISVVRAGLESRFTPAGQIWGGDTWDLGSSGGVVITLIGWDGILAIEAGVGI